MADKMNEKMIEVANEALEKCDEYFHEYAKEHSKKGYVWLKNDETGQLMVYTRGEYAEQIIELLSTLK
ncbi:hypothetical protein KYJ26_16805 [Bacillus sp. MCCB 382]|uniref:hypothetical protein n=1 Tax=Bacillus sp. MCCB 382 TaxID=2860197 RepID=UPI001C55E3FC|nr:hypothetical protein [Bacillus sp. MCCB 382]